MASPARRLTLGRLPASIRAGLGLRGPWRTIAIGLVAISPVPAFVFSMITNNYTVPTSMANNIQDLVCERLANFSRKI